MHLCGFFDWSHLLNAVVDRNHSSDQKARITHCKPHGDRIISDPDIHIARRDLAHGDADGADCKPFI